MRCACSLCALSSATLPVALGAPGGPSSSPRAAPAVRPLSRARGGAGQGRAGGSAAPAVTQRAGWRADAAPGAGAGGSGPVSFLSPAGAARPAPGRGGGAGVKPGERAESGPGGGEGSAMPLLFLERFPWPSLRTYTALSALALLGAGLSAYRALSQAPCGAAGTEPAEPPRCAGPRALDVAYYLLSDSLCVWVSPGRRRGLRARGLRGWQRDRPLPAPPRGRGRWAAPGGVRLLLFENCSRNEEGARLGLPCPPWAASAAASLPAWPGRWGSVRAERPEFSPRLALLSPSAPRSSCPGLWERLLGAFVADPGACWA